MAGSFEVLEPESWSNRTAIILAHGAGQGMHSPFMTYFHTELAKRGFLSVKFNFEYMDAKRHLPDPQPKLQARYRTVVENVLAEYKPARLVIGGKSMGGRVASYIAGDTPGVNALVSLGYPLHPPGKMDQLRDQHLYALKIPMLFISGTKDTFAERSLLERVVKKIGANARLVWIEGGDHSLKRGRKDNDSLSLALDAIDQWTRVQY
jgi:predicted alpha/beta-hydrolase family hydrolase